MKILLGFMLLLFASVANANHHRAHALMFLDHADGKMLAAKNVNYPNLHIPAGAPFSTEQAQKFHASLLVLINSARDRIASAKLALNNSVDCSAFAANGLLSGVRRNINQPKAFSTSPENAALVKVAQASYHLGQLIRYAQPSELNVQAVGAVLRNMSEGWEFLDFALWHVTDAYLEEIDLRDVNAGHAPGVDPLNLAPEYLKDQCPDVN